MNLQERTPELRSLVESEHGVVAVVDGLGFTEGPIWNPDEQALVFSDLNHDRLVRWSERDGATTFRAPSNKANGNAWDRAGGIITCEHATSRISRLSRDGGYTVLADEFQGREFNSPNDVIVRGDGLIFFTDPIYGRIREDIGLLRPIPQPFRGVFRLHPDGDVALLADDFLQPNGICLSLDERLLFVNDTHALHIRVFDLDGDGALSNGRIWAETVDTNGEKPDGRHAHTSVGVKPDGMKFDSAGNLFCTGPGGIHIFDSAASCLGVIAIPQPPTNFAFGDSDLKSLYVTAGTTLYRARLTVPGTCYFR
jgi:gluconolactonase